MFRSKKLIYGLVSVLIILNFIVMPYVLKQDPSNFATAFILLTIVTMIARINLDNKH
jgi:hypothetical protein